MTASRLWSTQASARRRCDSGPTSAVCLISPAMLAPRTSTGNDTRRWTRVVRPPAKVGAMAGLITYVGHSTLLIEMDGTRILTDPVLRSGIGHIRRIVPLPTADLAVDGIIVSHPHHDHLDLKSLKMIPKGPTVVAPPLVAALIGARTGHETAGVPAGERIRVGNLDVIGTEAVHDG